jgi:acetolactate synthase I/III small subunit
VIARATPSVDAWRFSLRRHAELSSIRALMRHIITLLLQNEAGALARVAGMFSSRGYNIDSLSVAPTEDPLVSRLTLVTFGSDAVVHQIVQQTRKVVDVVDIRDLSLTDHLESELVLVKVRAAAGQGDAIIECAHRHGAVILDDQDGIQVLKHSGTALENDLLINELTERASLIELVRSGLAAIERGAACLSVPQTADAVERSSQP